MAARRQLGPRHAGRRVRRRQTVDPGGRTPGAILVTAQHRPYRLQPVHGRGRDRAVWRAARRSTPVSRGRRRSLADTATGQSESRRRAFARRPGNARALRHRLQLLSRSIPRGGKPGNCIDRLSVPNIHFGTPLFPFRVRVEGCAGVSEDTPMIVRSSRRDAASTSADACAEASDAAAGLDKIAAALESGEKRVPRQHEDLARESRRFRTLLAHAADGLVLIDENLTFLYASPTTTHMLGVSLDEFVGRTAAHFAHADDKPAVLASLHEILGTPRAFSSLTFRAQRPDGSIRWVDAEASNLLTDADVHAIVCKYRDITEARNAQDLLVTMRDELGRFSLAIEQSADSVIVTNRGGIIEYVNPAFETMTGYRRDECL